MISGSSVWSNDTIMKMVYSPFLDTVQHKMKLITLEKIFYFSKSIFYHITNTFIYFHLFNNISEQKNSLHGIYLLRTFGKPAGKGTSRIAVFAGEILSLSSSSFRFLWMWDDLTTQPTAFKWVVNLSSGTKMSTEVH